MNLNSSDYFVDNKTKAKLDFGKNIVCSFSFRIFIYIL